MMTFRSLNLTLCACAAVTLLGCNDRPNSEPLGSPPKSILNQKPSGAPVESAAITVTPKAATTIRQLIADQSTASKLYLRVRVVPGGCQGFMHKLDLDPVITGEDQVCESAGVSVVTLKRQAEMLKGTEIDFGEENGKQGFKVENPNFKGESAKRWLAVLEKEKDIK